MPRIALSFESLKYILILFTNFVCSCYIFFKLSKHSLKKSHKIYITIIAIMIPVFSSFMFNSEIIFYRFIFMLLTIISFIVLNPKKYYSTIPTSVISVGISYGIEIISVILISTVYFIFGYHDPTLLSDIFTALTQVIITYLLMKIKRLRNGLVFFNNKNNFGLGLLISGPIFILASMSKEKFSLDTVAFVLLGIIIFIVGLFLWLRSAFTRYYRKRLKLRAEEYSKVELSEKAEEIEKLLAENASLSSIIHLDNHIIQIIETQLKELNSPEATEKILTAVNQRNEYVNDKLIKSKNMPSTGSAEIDAVLAGLYIKSASRGIDYNLNTDCDINYLLNNLISKDDFEILLREIITNSIVSVENNPDTPGRILIKISQPNDIYELTIMDNGITKDDINSISEIIKKSNASILTKNFDDNGSFTNSITVRFDGLNNNTQ